MFPAKCADALTSSLKLVDLQSNCFFPVTIVLFDVLLPTRVYHGNTDEHDRSDHPQTCTLYDNEECVECMGKNMLCKSS